jgi:ferredoxin
VKVTVTNRCQGHNRCLMFDTDMFVPDELGFVSVAGTGLVPADEESEVALAADNCPELAIVIVRDE